MVRDLLKPIKFALSKFKKSLISFKLGTILGSLQKRSDRAQTGVKLVRHRGSTQRSRIKGRSLQRPDRQRTARKRSKSFAEILLMNDLYKRLRRVGFDEEFVRKNLLPDWWDDSLATVPSNRALAEASISRMLGFSVGDLRNQKQELQLP